MDHPIKKASQHVGDQKTLARILGVHPSYLSQVVTGVRKISHTYCEHIENITDGEVTRYELRPDIFGEPPSLSVNS